MRNLKKILALVLALVMSLSLMATAGAADAAASNSETITAGYQTAVDVLKGVKVFNGYSDGTFKPQQTITRAEVAAILYRIATGDVTDAKKDIYTDMANVNFTDLAGANWAKGYINYCSNAELIVGMGDGTFRPSQPISGYATLAMILRALGYDQNNEFKGSGWELRTASKARELGILNNVTGDLGSYATREMVAEILFRAILNETVTYSPMNQNGYQKTGTTLAKQNLSLEEVEGVVVANEYANLDGTSTLANDKTKLDTHAAQLDYHTTLDDIGESRLAYIHKGSTVLSIADTGKNNTAESTAALSNLDSLKTEAGISGKAEGENYVNFDKYDQCDSDYRIKYVLNSNEGLLLGGMTTAEVRDLINAAGSGNRKVATLSADETAVEVVLTPGTPITKVDLDYMRAIFGKADKTAEGANIYVDGEVYVGTQSVKDISDDYNYSYEKFEDEFIDFDTVATVSANERGNWVKVIDNNGDGVTDYIFKVVYTVAQISNVKDDSYTLDTKNHVLGVHHPDAAIKAETYFNNVTTEKVVATNGETFAKGDVVYYAVIDGRAQTVKCDTVTAQIEKVDHNKLIATTTDGTEYTESQVCEHIEDEAYESRVRLLSGKVSYELFFDRGGYLAAFVKTDKVGDFQLITDGWYNRLKVNKEFAVRVYNDETAKQDIVDLTANGDLFIYNKPDDVIQNNNWGALKGLGGMDKVLNYSNGEKDEIRTTVAAITADGTILPVENSAVTGRYEHAMIDMVKAADNSFNIPLRTAAKGNVYDTAPGAENAYDTPTRAQVDVRALDNTIYYVAYPDDAMESGIHVLSYTGYNSGIKDAFDKWVKDGYVEDVYAVGTLHRAENSLSDTADYYTADVVVIELNKYDQAGDLVLVLDDTARFSDVRLRDVQIIDSKGELKTVTVDWRGVTLSYSDNRDRHKQIQPGLYYLHTTSEDNIYTLRDEDGNLTNKPLDAQAILETGCIATGQVKHHEWLANNKYVVVNKWDTNIVNPEDVTTEGQYDLSDETPLYYVAYEQPEVLEYYNGGRVPGYYEAVPSISKVDHDTAFKARVNETENAALYRDGFRDDEFVRANHNTVYYNYNDVMVYYSGNKAVYAVSFENVYSDSDREYDYAQVLWNNVIPAAADTTKYVKFYGVEVSADTHYIEVPYDVALAWSNNTDNAKKDALDIKGANAWFVTDNDTQETKVPHAPDKKGPVYQLNVRWSADSAWEMWTLAVEAADEHKGLTYNGQPVSTVAATPTEYRGIETTLANVQAQFETNSKLGDAGVVWSWTDARGDEVKGDEDQTVFGEGFKATAVVTAQDDSTATYYIVCHRTGIVVPTEGVDVAVTLNDELGFVTWFWNNPDDENDKTYTDFAITGSPVKADANNAASIVLANVLTGCPTIGNAEGVGDWEVRVAGTNCTAAYDYATGVISVTDATEGASVLVGLRYHGTASLIKPEVVDPDNPNPTPTPDPDPDNPDPEEPDPEPPIEVNPTPDVPGGFGRPAMRLGRTLDWNPGEETEIAYYFILEKGREIKSVEVNGKPYDMSKVTKYGDGTTPETANQTLWQIMLPQGGSYTLKIYLKSVNAPDTYTFTVIYNAEQADVTVNDVAYTAPVEVEAGSVAFTVAAKEGFEVKSVKNGETVLTGTDGKYTATVTDADVTITVETAEEGTEPTGDVTVNVKGRAVMDYEETATGTEDEVTFTIKMNKPNYKPAAPTATGAAEDWTVSADTVKMEVAKDGVTWTVTVIGAKDGMTLDFAATALKGITVKALQANIADITDITPTVKYMIESGKFVFNFNVTDKKTPSIDSYNAASSGYTYSLVRGTTATGWELTVEPESITAKDLDINLACDDTKYVTINVDKTSTIKGETQRKVDIVGERIEFKVDVSKAENIPVVVDDTPTATWTYKYDEAAKIWTVIGESANWGDTPAFTIKTAGQTAVKLNKGDGVTAIDRTVIYPCEATGTVGEEALTVKVTLEAGCSKGADVGGVGSETIKWADPVDGVSVVTIKKSAITGDSITLTATPAPNPKLSATGDHIYISDFAGVYDSTNRKTTYTLAKTDVDDNVTIENDHILASNSSPVAGAKATRSADGIWTIVVPFTPGDTGYTVSATPLYTVSMTAGEDEEEGSIEIGTATSEDKYNLSKKTIIQFKVKEGAVPTLALAEDSAEIALPTPKPNAAASVGGWAAYDVEFTNSALSAAGGDVALVVTTEARNNHTVTITANPNGENWELVSDKSVTTNLDFVTATVHMTPVLFPFVSVPDGCDVSYEKEMEQIDGMNVWNITLSGIDADKDVTIVSVEEATLITATNAAEFGVDSFGSLPYLGTNLSITETLDTDGTHIITISGSRVANWVDKAWWDAVNPTEAPIGVEALAAKKTMADVFPGFYANSEEASWAKFVELSLTGTDITEEDDAKAALIAIECPGYGSASGDDVWLFATAGREVTGRSTSYVTYKFVVDESITMSTSGRLDSVASRDE